MVVVFGGYVDCCFGGRREGGRRWATVHTFEGWNQGTTYIVRCICEGEALDGGALRAFFFICFISY